MKCSGKSVIIIFVEPLFFIYAHGYVNMNKNLKAIGMKHYMCFLKV